MSGLPLGALSCLLCLCLALPARAAAQADLVLNSAAGPPRTTPEGTGVQDRIVTEAFRRIGVSVRFVALPPERGITSADQGKIDGDCWRVRGREAQYPNLVMVPEPVDEAAINVFTRRADLAVAGWDSLGPYSVAFIRGWKILEQNVRRASKITRAQDAEALFRLLAGDHVDLVLVDPLLGRQTMHRLGLTGIRMLPEPLTRQDMFLYLHRRHAALLPRLSEALRAMRHDGTLARLTREGLAPKGAADMPPQGGAR